MRERMEEHRANPTCKSCHQFMDPIGLALENFDVTGSWRIRENGVPLDTRGELYDGTQSRPRRSARGAAQAPEPLMRTFTRNLMAYGLGRRVEYYDMPTIRAIVRGAAANDYRMSSFMLGVVRATRSACRAREALAARRTSHSGWPTETTENSAFITGKHLPRRTFLQGMGATVALPLLDAMIAGAPRWSGAAGSAGRPRRGSSASRWCTARPAATTCGASQNSLVAGGGRARLRSDADGARSRSSHTGSTSRSSATPTCGWPRRITPEEIGGDHFRSSAVFLTQSHPKQTEGSDIYVGTSLDQIYAKRFGQDTPIPSMQLCIENVDQAGGCAYGYACVYTDTISWASPTEPLPMIRDPRVAFDQLFGVGGTAAERAARRETHGSILDWITGRVARLKRELGAGRSRRMDQYLENIREIERRIQRIEAHNSSGEQRELPGAPAGVPDSFDEHVKLMFDLQVLAFAADMTRVFSLKMGRDASSRVYPESGVDDRLPPGVASRQQRRSASRSSIRSTSTTSACCRTSSTS